MRESQNKSKSNSVHALQAKKVNPFFAKNAVRQKTDPFFRPKMMVQQMPEVAQRQAMEEEEPLQAKSVLQKMEGEELDEEPIQGKSISQKMEMEDEEPIQPKANNTGLPDKLKAGAENLSGYSMDDVKVHYNSAKPAQLNAHAYAQGTDIHLAAGQENHLPHEAWHVVQQKQGRVRATRQMKGGVNINDDVRLEQEADMMGEKALQMTAKENNSPFRQNALVSTNLLQDDPSAGIQLATDFQDYVEHFTGNDNNLAYHIGALLDYNEYERQELMDKIQHEQGTQANPTIDSIIQGLQERDISFDLESLARSLLTVNRMIPGIFMDSGRLMAEMSRLVHGHNAGNFSQITWGQTRHPGMGTSVRARLRPDAAGLGSDAGGDPAWMLNLQQRVDNGNRSLYVRGHLLNRHLGGPGLDYNMVPLTQSGAWGANDANGVHSRSIEETVKGMYLLVDNGREDEATNLRYQVIADFNRGARGQTAQIGQLTQNFKTIFNEFVNRASNQNDPQIDGIELQDDQTVVNAWNNVTDYSPFPGEKNAFDRNLMIRMLRTHFARPSIDAQIMFLPHNLKLWLLGQIQGIPNLQTVLRAVSPNPNFQTMTLSSLNYRMGENHDLWQQEDQLVPSRLRLVATWTQFGNNERIEDTVNIRIPTSLAAKFRLRNE